MRHSYCEQHLCDQPSTGVLVRAPLMMNRPDSWPDRVSCSLLRQGSAKLHMVCKELATRQIKQQQQQQLQQQVNCSLGAFNGRQRKPKSNINQLASDGSWLARSIFDAITSIYHQRNSTFCGAGAIMLAPILAAKPLEIESCEY